ncbi:TipC family immunity protein [Streptococcus sp. CSL10205-OR2]|uniref:TipC family immunity protein n=1 Tax=Streptococcus sp. CSL10205-OR2 TaxID=2980558 RepID=UPI0021D9DE08|nr:TipC family immunity protein [Streptococcus sp. CSL10205-OR2]MCU9534077.1 TipC family immunity protein [Streptococcus sp. CSL10205-OR2]
MTKRKFYRLLFIGLLAPFIILIGLFFYHSSYSNIFEQMYFDEYHSATGVFRHYSTLRGLPDVKNARVPGPLEPGLNMDIISEEYDETKLPQDIKHIGVSFYYPDYKTENGNLIIGISKILDNNHFLTALYHYNHKQKTLTHELILESDGEESYDKEEIASQLASYHMTLEDAYKATDTILKEKLLKDWTQNYWSWYSPDNWGDVKRIQKQREPEDIP